MYMYEYDSPFVLSGAFTENGALGANILWSLLIEVEPQRRDKS